jgi:CheY-like chemotaxis protein
VAATPAKARITRNATDEVLRLAGAFLEGASSTPALIDRCAAAARSATGGRAALLYLPDACGSLALFAFDGRAEAPPGLLGRAIGERPPPALAAWSARVGLAGLVIARVPLARHDEREGLLVVGFATAANHKTGHVVELMGYVLGTALKNRLFVPEHDLRLREQAHGTALRQVAHRLRATEVPAGRLSGRVLLVEDDADSSAATCELLELHGLETVGVATGHEALQRVQAESFDLIISDLGLPDMDGFDVVRAVRRMRSVPICLLTGHAVGPHPIAGVTRVFRKPVNDADAFIAQIGALLPAAVTARARRRTR